MINYSIIYEDQSIILVNKPQGLPTAFGLKNNLCELVFKDLPKLKSVKGYKNNEGGLLNRLDNETGGIVFFAKTDTAFDYYSEEMKKGAIDKIYTAVVDGEVFSKNGVIDCPIAHHQKDKKRMVVAENNPKFRGRPRKAETHWKLIDSNNKMSVLELNIKKGVRHQIRVHLAKIGHPIIGDKLYNKNMSFLKQPFHLLFANGVRFISKEHKKIEIFIEVPFLKEINELLKK